jgi:hypothetical protein
MDPALVRDVLPGATGLTSRLQDKDTRDFTLLGNMKLTATEKQALVTLRQGEANLKNLTSDRLKTRK